MEISFNQKSDLNQNTILREISQEEIFKYCIGFIPVLDGKITNPLRDDDNSPGAWFEFDDKGFLVLKDFAFGKKPTNCFDAVGIAYNLQKEDDILLFIKNNIIGGKKPNIKTIKKQLNQVKKKKEDKKPIEILFSPRDFYKRDQVYWKKFGITLNNLIEDEVYTTSNFKMLNTKKGDITFNLKTLAYVYTDFLNRNEVKIYMPYNKKKKFITNCSNNSVSGKDNGKREVLVITKSYKDYRVLKNLGLNCRWLPNEGMFPDKETLHNLTKDYKKTIIFFDNDKQGIKAGEELQTMIFNSKFIYLKGFDNKIKDPANMVEYNKKKELIQFLKKEIYD